MSACSPEPDRCVVSCSDPWCVLSLSGILRLPPCAVDIHQRAEQPRHPHLSHQEQMETVTKPGLWPDKQERFPFKGQRIFKLASLLPPLCLRFSLKKKKSVYPSSFSNRKMKVLSPIFIWGYQSFIRLQRWRFRVFHI